MLVSCIAITDGISTDSIHNSIESFSLQKYINKQLVIINNSHNKIEFPYDRNILLVDRYEFSNSKSLNLAIEISAGQIIAHYPLNYFHHDNRLDVLVENLNENLVVCQDRYVDKHGVEFVDNINCIVPELAAYKSPAYTEYFDMKYGAWWSYLLLMNRHGIDIINIPLHLSTKLS